MPTEITDLDEILGAPKRVKLNGKVYTLPAQIPVPLYLRLRAEEKAHDEAQAKGDGDWDQRVTDLNDLVLELFQVHQPELKDLPVGLVQLFSIVGLVYGQARVDEEKNDDPKPRTRARGKQSTRKAKASRSRS